MRFAKCNIAITAMLILTATAAAQSFSPGGPLVVYDANGKIVGQVITLVGSNTYVSVIVNGRPTFIDVRRPIIGESGILYFPQPNCQGDAFMDYGSVDPLNSLMARTFKAPDGSLRVNTSMTASPRAYASTWRNYNQECANLSGTLDVSFATEVGPNVATLFTPPFSIGPGNVPPLPATERVTLIALLLAVAAIAVVRLRA
jgi:hypothetical protein